MVVAVACIILSRKAGGWLLIVGCCLGIIRGWAAVPVALPPAGSVVVGVVADDPIETWQQQYPLKTKFGTWRVYGRGTVAFGDEVEVACLTMKRPTRFADITCYADSIRVVRNRAAPAYLTWLHDLRSCLTRAVNRALPSPEAPLLSGILLGSRSEMPESLVESFRRTGTSHIVAVSGYNVTIVVALIAAAFSRLPLRRNLTSTLTLLGIVSFVILTGASASVVRAGIMGGLVVLAQAVGRVGNPMHALVLSATGMVVASPAIAADVGFQLSVAATFGLIGLADAVIGWLRWMPDRFGIRTSFGTTLAAIIATEPMIVFTFGRTSLIAPFVNLLVLPLIPVAMALGFGLAMVEILIPTFSPLVGWAAWLPLTLVVRIVDWASGFSFASVGVSTTASVMIAGCMAWMAVGLFVRQTRRRP